jgi:hypothetical protein
MTHEQRSSPSVRRRSLQALRFVLIVIAVSTTVGVDRLVATSCAQQPASDSTDSEEQTLHDPASLDQADVEPPAAADSTEPRAETVPPAVPPSKRDLLGEKIAEGEGAEPGTLPFESDDGSFVLVTTKPHFTPQQAKNELDRVMLEAADERYKAAVHSPRAPFWFPLDLAYVRSELLVPDGERFIRNHEGKYVGHALITLDQPFERRLRAVRVASRSMQIVAAGGAALALMVVAFAFLRLDRATRGLYTGRLQTWAVVACAVVACVTGIVAYWIPWI